MQDDTIPLTSEQKKNIGQRIRQVRMDKNYTIEELAEKIQMPVESLRRMEDGDFELYRDNISKVNILLS